MRLHEKTALVTGSSRGLGRHIALRFAQEGANIVVNYLSNARAADEVASEARTLGVEAVIIQADTTRSDQVEAMFGAAADRFGKIDIVVANAGVEKVNIPVAEISDEDFDNLMRVNTFGPFYVLRAAARNIADGGRIINVSSSTAVYPKQGMGLYGTSKSASRYLSKVLALELGSRQITVNNLVPGAVWGAGIFESIDPHDGFVKGLVSSVPLGRLATPDDVADLATFLAGDESVFVTGQDVIMNGGGDQ